MVMAFIFSVVTNLSLGFSNMNLVSRFLPRFIYPGLVLGFF